jgi:dUTP diphosphatase
MRVRLHRANRDIPVPVYRTRGSVGFDLVVARDVRLAPGEIALAPTGITVEVPDGWSLLVCLRSSTPTRHGVIQPHAIGVIDQDYCGPDDELMLQLLNYTQRAVEIAAFTPVAQGVFVRVAAATWEEYEPSGSSRGGLGSTG